MKLKRSALTPLREAQDPCTAAERLRSLAALGGAVRRAVAKNPATSPALLATFYEEPSLRKLIAQNPNTPPALLLSLASQHPQEVLQNPALELLCLENPASLRAMPEEAACKLASFSKTSPQLLSLLAQHEAATVQIKLSKNHNTPAAALAILLEKDPEGFGLPVAHHANADTNTVARLLLSGREGVRGAAAKHPNAPGDLLALLRRAGFSEKLRAPRQLNPLSERELEHLLLYGAYIASMIAASSYTPEPILLKLCQHPARLVRVSVAGNASLPPEGLELLAEDPEIAVRAAIAKNPGLPLLLLRKVALDRDPSVRAAVVKNRYTPADVLRALSSDTSARMFTGFLLAQHPNCPAEIRERLLFELAARWRD